MYHLTTRSIAEEVIFRDAGDYAAGLTTIAGVVTEGLMTCHMVCLMPTHYHLLASVEPEDVSRVLHKINRRYAVRFNRRHRRRGRVFDPPPTAILIETEPHFLECIRYIANNPADPEGWAYSSYPALLGLREPFSFVDPAPILGAFRDVAALRRFVDQRREDTNAVPPSAGTTFEGTQP